ncbi:hypothetical protein [Nocardia niwae]|uniref:DUF2892 domain-containing protein n=1 Tax=Nocardia niwae TaxID=626084 RepID=A0ABV2X7M1_9NOCA|nr:hypothetical protein [Nocardia niwae]
MTDERSFASVSVPRHLARGVIGFGALIGAIALMPVLGAFGLLLAPVGFLALRGCPTCWLIGLMQTVSRGRLQRSCTDGQCRLTTAGHGGGEHAAVDRAPAAFVSLSSDHGVADRSPRHFSSRD